VDDSITLLPDVQTIGLNYTAIGAVLQFDFTTTGIDLTQPVNLSITAVGDLDQSTEYYDIFAILIHSLRMVRLLLPLHQPLQ